MYQYKAYGLGFQSEIFLPEMVDGDLKPDISIRLGGQAPTHCAGLPDQGWLTITHNEAVYYHRKFGKFTALDGKQIILAAYPGIRDSILRVYATGLMMAAVLHQRSRLVLHASSVEVNGVPVAFMGDSQSGKSSLAAVLVRRGHKLIADDVTAIERNPDTITTHPGYSQIKINPRVAELLQIEKDQLYAIDPLDSRLAWRIPQHGLQPEYPLRKMYVLYPGEDNQINPIRPHEAVIELTHHAFPNRFTQRGIPEQLFQCAEIVNNIPIYRLKRPPNLQNLSNLARMLEEDILRT